MFKTCAKRTEEIDIEISINIAIREEKGVTEDNGKGKEIVD